MRIGLDLTGLNDPEERLALAAEADRLGLWAVLVGGSSGLGTVDAAAIAVDTSWIHLAVLLDGDDEHPLTLAEELSVLDHLSERRILAVISGASDRTEHVARLLSGHIVDGTALTPAPAQTELTVWRAEDITRVQLEGHIERDAAIIDEYRDGGCTHLFVSWPGQLPVLARHLVTRAVGPGFPQVVADQADLIDPTSS